MTNKDAIFYAKGLFYRSLPEYKKMSISERRAILEDVETRMKERLKYTGGRKMITPYAPGGCLGLKTI